MKWRFPCSSRTHLCPQQPSRRRKKRNSWYFGSGKPLDTRWNHRANKRNGSSGTRGRNGSHLVERIYDKKERKWSFDCDLSLQSESTFRGWKDCQNEKHSGQIWRSTLVQGGRWLNDLSSRWSQFLSRSALQSGDIFTLGKNYEWRNRRIA
jgi:hypothetical protein